MFLQQLCRIRTGRAITFILLVNIVCFLSLSYQGVFVFSSSSKQKQTSLQGISDHTPLKQTTLSVRVTTYNPVRAKKVSFLKQMLNISSTATSSTVYPADQVGKFLMLNPDLCSGTEKVDVIIIVHTAPKNLEKRQRIRDTFAQSSFYYPFQIRVAFLLGKTLNRTLERILWLEHVRYNDTIMSDFIDDYHNLTIKGVMGYKFIHEYCSNSRIVLKIDDDVMVNMYKLLYSYYNQMVRKRKSIFCNMWHKDTMPILRRGKWKVETHMFFNRTVFPYDYCSGFVVLMTTDLMGPMFEAAKTLPFFWIDDLYLFGMLPSAVGGVTFYNYPLDKNLSLNDAFTMNCTRNLGPKCPVLGTTITDKNFWSLWNLIKDLYFPSSWTAEKKIV